MPHGSAGSHTAASSLTGGGEGTRDLPPVLLSPGVVRIPTPLDMASWLTWLTALDGVAQPEMVLPGVALPETADEAASSSCGASAAVMIGPLRKSALILLPERVPTFRYL